MAVTSRRTETVPLLHAGSVCADFKPHQGITTVQIKPPLLGRKVLTVFSRCCPGLTQSFPCPLAPGRAASPEGQLFTPPRAHFSLHHATQPEPELAYLQDNTLAPLLPSLQPSLLSSPRLQTESPRPGALTAYNPSPQRCHDPLSMSSSLPLPRPAPSAEAPPPSRRRSRGVFALPR